MRFFLHRVAALYLRLRKKRVPLEDLLSAWAGGRWHMGVYKAPQKPRLELLSPDAGAEAFRAQGHRERMRRGDRG